MESNQQVGHLTDNLTIQTYSLYRKELMGIAILGVMVNHWLGWVGITEGLLYSILSSINNWIFTPGLLLLSGFGLYYSFSNNNNLLSFYKRRCVRLYVPFVLLSTPLYLFFLYTRDDYNIVTFFSQITTLYFWTNGNYGGMWYVAVSLVLYLLFPIFYRIIFGNNMNRRVVLKGIILVVFFYAFIMLLMGLNGSYFKMVEIGLSQMPYFIIGIIIGYLSKNDLLRGKRYVLFFIAVTIIFIVTYYFKDQGYLVLAVCGVSQKLFYISLISVFLNFVFIQKHFGFLYVVLGWLGSYSLELYILHLHFYRFFEYSHIDTIPLYYLASMAIILAVILCVPVHLLLKKIT